MAEVLGSECFICPPETRKCAHFNGEVVRLRFPSKTTWVVEHIIGEWSESHYCTPKPGHLFDHLREQLRTS